MARNKKKIIRACTVPLSIRFFEDIIVRMKNDGYESVVVTSPGKNLNDFKQRHPDIRAIELPMERRISIWKDFVALLRMVWLFMKERPYVVHSITPKAGLLCMMAGWMTGVPVRIHTFTGLVWPTSKGLKRKILMTTDKILCACATHINPEGTGVMNDLRNGGITKKPMKVLGYGNVKGVDMDYFNPARFENVKKDNEMFTFLFVGRIVGDKGMNELIEAFVKLHEKYEKTKLVLVGPYENNIDPVSDSTRNCINDNPAVVMAGTKYGDDLLKEYMKADCHVLPSYREGFPNTPMEAGAMGLPNIVTDINGSREIVVDSNFNFDFDENGIKICDNGIIVPPRTVQPLYNAMERMLTDNAMRERMRLNARPMIESRFEKSFVQGCLMEYYNEVIV